MLLLPPRSDRRLACRGLGDRRAACRYDGSAARLSWVGRQASRLSLRRRSANPGPLPGRDLVVNPGVGLLQPVPQPGPRRPAEQRLDPGVVAVAAVDPLGGTQVVRPFQLDAGDVLD